jgi:hypothetical protein
MMRAPNMYWVCLPKTRSPPIRLALASLCTRSMDENNAIGLKISGIDCDKRR